MATTAESMAVGQLPLIDDLRDARFGPPVVDDSRTPLAIRILDRLGEKSVGAPGFFERVQWAAGVVKDSRRDNPKHAGRLDKVLRHLCWPEGGYIPKRMCRHHAEELLNRVLEGGDLDELTQAEILMHLHRASREQALNPVAHALMARIFEEIFGAPLEEPERLLVEPWPGACDELIVAFRRKHARRARRRKHCDGREDDA
jgi:hypothetical protein